MILILNGSPNKDSATMTISNDLIKKSKEEVIIINTYDLNITSCDDCKYCSKKIGCKYKDDMEKIDDLLFQTDTLILSSPIYFGAFSDTLLKVLNRFQRYYGQKYDLKDNNTPTVTNLITVTTQGSLRKEMFNGAKLTHSILTSLLKPTYNDLIQAKNSDKDMPLSQKYIIKKIKKVSLKLRFK